MGHRVRRRPGPEDRPEDEHRRARLRGDGSPCGIVFVDGRCGSGASRGEVVDQVDPTTGEVVSDPGRRAGLRRAGRVRLRVGVNRDGNHVVRIDPATAKVVAGSRAGALLYGLAVTPDGVWATAQLDNTVVRVDPKTNKRVDMIHDPVTSRSRSRRRRAGCGSRTRDGHGRRARPDDRHVRREGARRRRRIGRRPGHGGRVRLVPRPASGRPRSGSTRDREGHRRVQLESGYSVAQEGFGDVWVANFGLGHRADRPVEGRGIARPTAGSIPRAMEAPARTRSRNPVRPRSSSTSPCTTSNGRAGATRRSSSCTASAGPR